MREMFSSLIRELERGEAAMLVTVLEARGSTPRNAGAMMAVFAGGRFAGTIGGGNVELEALALCPRLLEEKRNHHGTFRFIQGRAGAETAGGTVALHFQYLPGGGGESTAVFRRLAELAGRNGGAWLVRRLEGDRVTAMSAAALGEADPALLGERTVLTAEGWLSVPIAPPGRLYVFGGGHVSRSLVPAAARVGFRPVVYDDRVEFACRDRFPEAEEVLWGEFGDLSRRVTVTERDYVVVITSSPETDCRVLEQVLRSGAKYVGCIGSDRKLAICRERLLAAGFTAEEYGRIHAPIGLPIGAETPEEIAVAITAELIAVRAGILK